MSRGGTIALYWGAYGGFNLTRTPAGSARLCLGWVALVYYPEDLDLRFERAVQLGRKMGRQEEEEN